MNGAHNYSKIIIYVKNNNATDMIRKHENKIFFVKFVTYFFAEGRFV